MDAQLKALQPEETGHLWKPDGSRKDAWLPVPTIAATGGRRTLYVTVAFTPQLKQMSDADYDAEERKHVGEVVAIPLEELGLKPQQSVPRRKVPDPQLRVLHKTIALLRSLDQRVGEVNEPDLTGENTKDEEVADCSVDGWRELDVGKAASTLGFGDR